MCGGVGNWQCESPPNIRNVTREDTKEEESTRHYEVKYRV